MTAFPSVRHQRLLALGVLILVTLASLCAAPIRAADSQAVATTVNLGTFVRTLPMLAAQAKGFYAEHNLAVHYLQVRSSTQQFQALRDGEYDIAMTSPDNVLNYRFNAHNALGAPLDAQIIAGTDYGMRMALVARPGISSVADLRGATVAVDSPVSGFAYVLYEMLGAAGLELGRDYSIAVAGGMLSRYRGLLAGEFDATLLSYGFELRAATQGYATLETVEQVIDPYLGQVFAAREAWLEQNSDTAVRLIHAYYEALQWSLDPANREEAIHLLMPVANYDRAIAEQLYAIQVAPGVGLVRDASIERDALLSVIKLRQKFGGFEEQQDAQYLASPGSGLYHLLYYNLARQRYRQEAQR